MTSISKKLRFDRDGKAQSIRSMDIPLILMLEGVRLHRWSLSMPWTCPLYRARGGRYPTRGTSRADNPKILHAWPLVVGTLFQACQSMGPLQNHLPHHPCPNGNETDYPCGFMVRCFLKHHTLKKRKKMMRWCQRRTRLRQWKKKKVRMRWCEFAAHNNGYALSCIHALT